MSSQPDDGKIKRKIMRVVLVLAWLLLLFPIGAVAQEVLQVAEEDQICEQDADCTTVQTGCGGCYPCGAPINRIYEQKYIEQYDALCEHYSGAWCSSACEAKIVVCCHNRCALSMWDPQQRFATSGGPKRFEANSGPIPSPYVASQVALQFWAEQHKLHPCDFVDRWPECSVEDAGGLWRVKAPRHITPPLEIEIDKESGAVRDLEAHEPITKEILDR